MLLKQLSREHLYSLTDFKPFRENHFKGISCRKVTTTTVLPAIKNTINKNGVNHLKLQISYNTSEH